MDANSPEGGNEGPQHDYDYSLHYRRWHDGSADDYGSATNFFGRVLRPVFQDLHRGSKLLDFGCGTGLLVNALLCLGYDDVKGVDISDSQVRAALARGLPCERITPTWLDRPLPIELNSYDAIFLVDVLEHIATDQQIVLLARLRSLLKPDGRLVITVPNATFSFASRMRYIDWTHTSAFTEASLDFVLLNAGFQQIEYLPYEFCARPRAAWIPRLSAIRWYLWWLLRSLRRLQAYAEFGKEAWRMQFGPNLLAVAR